MNPEPLNSSIHKRLRVDLQCAIPADKTLRNSAVVLQEFPHLVLQYPIMLSKNQTTGRFSCVAIFGFDEGENLFIEDGRWQAVYIPLNVQREPLMIGTQAASDEAESGSEHVVFADFDDTRLQEKIGEPLFNERGFPSDYLQHGTALLKALKDGLQQTQAFIDTLLALELVVPAELKIEFADKSKRQINGLYTIDRQRLQALKSADIVDLHSRGYLEAIYTMLASFGHVHSLIARKNARIDGAASRSQTA